MANVKVAVSLPEPLFAQVEAVAKEMRVARSHVVADALADYLKRHENRRLLEQVNAAYGDGLDAEERELLQNMQRSFRKVTPDEW
jgi:metal-responsive CopG/Arc/MetJ family transcriptional regulator